MIALLKDSTTMTTLSKKAAALASRRYRRKHPERSNDSTRKYRKRNPEKRAALGLRWDRANPEKYLFLCARKRAGKNGIKFTITVEDVVIPTHCAWLGTLLDPVRSGRRSYGPSIDRIDNALGYVPGNVEIISTLANALKSDSTLEELARMGVVAKKRLENK